MEIEGQERAKQPAANKVSGQSQPLPRALSTPCPHTEGVGGAVTSPGRGSRAHREEGAAEARTYRG